MEAELLAPIPRPVPDSIRRHSRRRASESNTRRVSLTLLGLSLVGLFFQKSAWMHSLGLYFTPFSQFYWVGWILAAIGLWGLFLFWHPWTKDPYRYLRQGIPLVGRVVDLRMEVATRVNGADSTFAYDVYLEYPDPESGEMAGARIRSAEFGHGTTRLGCRVGDYLTAIYLPGQLATSLTLYGFTNTNPEADLLEKPDNSGQVKALLAFFFGLGMLFWGIFRFPLSSEAFGSLFLACLPFIGGGGLAGYFYYRRRERECAEQFRQAVEEGSVVAGATVRGPSRLGYIFLGLFCGGFLGAGALMWVNGALDFRQPTVVPVQIKNAYCTTHQGLVKTYDVEYVDPKTGKTEKAGVSPLELENATGGELVTHRGALGLPWETIHLTR